MIDSDAVDPVVVQVYLAMRSQQVKQKALAERVGISQKHLSQLFHGKTRPSLPMLRRLLDALGLELIVQRKQPEVHPITVLKVTEEQVQAAGIEVAALRSAGLEPDPWVLRLSETKPRSS